MPESIHDQIERERKAAIPKPDDITVYRNYAKGDHDKVMSADMLRHAAGLTKHQFADNACGKILALIASRLEFTGFSVKNSAVQTFLDELFIKNQLADKQYDTHYAQARDGDHAVLLGWKSDSGPMRPFDDPQPGGGGRVIIHRERWWDGKTGMWIAYDDRREKAYAVKEFNTLIGDPPREVKRRTIYFPDHLEKYVLRGSVWEPYEIDGDARPRWEKRNGAPLGIPVVHFANGSNDDTPYGVSILAGGVIGLQDHINDLHIDLTVAARLTGFPMVWVTGYQPEVINGVQQPFRVGPGIVMKSTSVDSKFGVLQPGSLKELIDTYQMKLKAIANNTHTPEHVITGGVWPSGLALIRAEMPLIAQVERMTKTTGPSWQEVGHRATEIANAFGAPGLDENVMIEAQFADPERLDETAKAESQKLQLEVWQAAGMIEDETILLKTGLFTPAEVAKLKAEREARAEAAVRQMVGAGVGESDQDEP